MNCENNNRSPVGGVDRSGKVDRINLPTAIETPFWLAVYATEPERLIDVRMTYEDLNIICELINQKKAGAEKWRPADERPTKEGVYWCVLLHDEYKNYKPTGRKLADIETRYFGVADGVGRGWVMDGEPETGLVWTEESGSWTGEKVWMWKPMLDDDLSKDVKLPDGYEWGDWT